MANYEPGSVGKYFSEICGFTVAGKRTLNGEALLVLEGKNSKLDLSFEALITGPPDFLVMRWVAKTKGKPAAIFEVKEVKRLKTGIFPAAGTFRQWPMGEAPEWTYEFKLISVETLSDQARKDWISIWPAKTAVGDYVNNKTIVIPPATKN